MSLASILLQLWFSAPAFALPEEGVKLGDVDLRDRKDWDVVQLPACGTGGNVPVTQIAIRVTGFPAQIDHLSVKFQNGGTEDFAVRERFEPNSRSRWIDLRGPARCIDSVRVVGDTNSLGWKPGRQAHVAVWGIAPVAAEAPLRPDQKVPPVVADAPGDETGATKLGEIGLQDAKDWDILRLGNCQEGGNIPITHLMMRVDNHQASINRLHVTYGNGSEQDLEVRNQFEAGSRSRWIDLVGPARCVTSIRVIGDTDSLGWRPGAQAHVVFFGKTVAPQ